MDLDACSSDIEDFRKFDHSWRRQFQLQSSVRWQFIRTPNCLSIVVIISGSMKGLSVHLSVSSIGSSSGVRRVCGQVIPIYSRGWQQMWAVFKYEFSLLRRLSIVTLLAFAAKRQALCLRRKPLLQSAGVCYRSISFAHRAHSSKPVGDRCCCRWMEEKTDGQTDAEAFHRPCYAYVAASIKRHYPNKDDFLPRDTMRPRYCCHEASYLKAKIHLIRFRLGVRPRPRWGSLHTIPPTFLSRFKPCTITIQTR